MGERDHRRVEEGRAPDRLSVPHAHLTPQLADGVDVGYLGHAAGHLRVQLGHPRLLHHDRADLVDPLALRDVLKLTNRANPDVQIAAVQQHPVLGAAERLSLGARPHCPGHRVEPTHRGEPGSKFIRVGRSVLHKVGNLLAQANRRRRVPRR